MKWKFVFIFLSFYFLVSAQKKSKFLSFAIKVGPLLTYNEERCRYSIEAGLEENKLGFGIFTRYVTEAERSFIFFKNPLSRKRKYEPLPNPIPKGTLILRLQSYDGFSFLLTKKLMQVRDRHRLDLGLGFTQRTGSEVYYVSPGSWFEPNLDFKSLDGNGLLIRSGYTFFITKHFTITTNLEYARFKISPANFFDVNVLIGVRF